jgi:PAS domain S-box-containing protein
LIDGVDGMPLKNDTEKDFPPEPRQPIDPPRLFSTNALNCHFLIFNFTTNPEGSAIQHGETLLEYLGYSEARPDSISLISLVHPVDKMYLKTILEQVATRQLSEKVHFRLVNQQGHYHYFSANSCISGENPRQIDFLIQDVTEERTEKQNLLQSVQQFRQLIEKSRDVIFQIDASKRTLIYVSPSVVYLTGYEPAELELIPVAEIIEIFVHPEEKADILKQFEIGFAAPEDHLLAINSCILRIRHRNGQIFRVECQFFPVRNSQAQIVHLLGYIQDITQTERLKYVLDESQENYRNIVENTQSLFAILDPQGIFKFASGQWNKMVGYFPEDLVQNSLIKLILPEDQETVAKILEKLALAPGNYVGIKYRLVTKTGEIYWQLANLASGVNKKNEVEKIYFISNDITRLEQAKLALNHRFEYEKMLSQISKDALAVRDSRDFIVTSLNKLGLGTRVDRVYLFININDSKRARLDFEWTSDTCRPLVGLVIDYSRLAQWKIRLEANEIIYDSGQSDALKMLADCGLISADDPRAVLFVPLTIQQRFYGFLGLEECRVARKWLPEDIDLIRMAAHIFEIRLEKDIEATHRQLIEQQLFESEKKYRQIVTDVPIGILHLSTNGTILDANPYTLNILKLNTVDDLHRVQVNGDYPASGGTDLISYIITQVHHETLLKNREINTHRNDGKPMILQLSASIQRDASRSSIINAVLEDVTEHRALEQQLLQSQKLESIGMLAGGIAHDFNNLLGGIIGYASLILSEMTPETNPLYWDIESILNISKRATELTNQLMTFSRSNRFQAKPCRVNWVIDEVVTLLSRTIDKAIEIRKETEKDLQFVMADSGQLQQAILNICINARDAISEKGVIQIITQNVALGQAFVEKHLNAVVGPHVLISIVDNGCGMDEKTRNRIFEPFFTTKERTGGTGLGLAVTYGIVNHHQGHLDVMSAPGKGTRFDIYLPVAQDVTDVIVEKSASEIFVGVETILVIDDEDIIRNISRRILERVGYQVLLASAGDEGIEIFRKKFKEIDLVLLDLVMPKISGVEVFHALVKIDPAVKVLVSSGYAEDELVRELKLKGVEHFIQKPFQPDELLNEIRNCLTAD